MNSDKKNVLAGCHAWHPMAPSSTRRPSSTVPGPPAAPHFADGAVLRLPHRVAAPLGAAALVLPSPASTPRAVRADLLRPGSSFAAARLVALVTRAVRLPLCRAARISVLAPQPSLGGFARVARRTLQAA